MPIKYTEDQIREKARDALKAPETLYKQGFVNDTTPDYTEIAAQAILDGIEHLENIKAITRSNTYNVPHIGKSTTGRTSEESNQREKHIAMGMLHATYDHIGEILNYEVPLKDKRADLAGKIDLFAWDEASQSLSVLELKSPSCKETLLRAVLEVFTYWKTADHDKLKADFGKPSTAKLRKGILIFEGKASNPHREFMGLDDASPIKQLMGKLEVDVYVLTGEPPRVARGLRWEGGKLAVL
ncbi:MAG: hypothetical protein LBJ10_01725 [Clostridiales bacterium]|jgi:hypothetical protein|nr:hypothetical protein [Clostridiales bacterium]